MDQKERSADFTGALKVALAGWQRGIWTSMPGIALSALAEDMTISVQPAIRAVVVVQDPATGAQTQKHVTLPQLIKVPVIFPGGGGYSFTFPVAKDDEVLVVFGSRCIDAWWQSGGVQNQIEFRAHDLSDGFAIPGLRSVPRKIDTISSDSVQLRSDDGEAFIEIASGHIVNITAPGGINMTGDVVMNGDVEMNGDLQVNGNINATGTIAP